jgi:hypothetical protein
MSGKSSSSLFEPQQGGESAAKGLGRIEGAISRLLGLILAFSFSGTLAVSGGNGETGCEVTGGTTTNAGT